MAQTWTHLDVPVVLVKLPSGLRVLFIKTTKHVHLAHVQVDVRTGDDDEGLSGSKFRETAHYLEHLVASMLYSRRFPNGEAKAWVEQHGIDSNAFTSAVRTSHYMSGHASLLDAMIDVQVGAVADFLRPEFYDEKLARGPRFEGEKQSVVRELLADIGDADYQMYEARNAAMFAGCPRAATQADDAKNVLRLTPDQVRDFFQRHYVAGNILITIAAPASVCDVQRLLGKIAAYEFIPTPACGLPERPAPPKLPDDDGNDGKDVRVIRVPVAAASTVHVNLVWRVRLAEYDAKRQRDVLALGALSSLLTGGFTSRLLNKLRVEDGMVYGVSAGRSLDERDAKYGLYIIETSVAAESLPRLLHETFDVLRGMSERGPTKEEMQKYLLNVETDMERRVANLSPGSWVSDYVNRVLFSETLRKNESHFRELLSLTSEDIQRVASEVVPFFTGAVVVLIGAADSTIVDIDVVKENVKMARAGQPLL